MTASILLATADPKHAEELSKFLVKAGYSVDIVYTGKECQLKAFQHKYTFLVLDLEIKSHTSLEVLRYFKQSASQVKVIITVKNAILLKQFGVDALELIKLGASEILIQPFTHQMLLAAIERDSLSDSWKDIEPAGPEKKEEVEVSASDSEFTKIPIKDFFSGTTAIYDCYLKLSRNKYLKFIHQGDIFDRERLNTYASEKNVDFLYFKTKERGKYINFTNQILEQAIQDDKGTALFKTTTAQNLSEKYIEEIYTQGIKPQLVEEGKKICENISKMIKREKKLDALLSEFKDYDKGEHGHLFLVSFFSSIICKNLDWATNRTIETVAMAGLLHDIGKLKLPPAIRTLNRESMNPSQMAQYNQHTLHGEVMLRNYACISEPVRQIIYQHHETIDGTGFPHGLSGIKIYPLAKVVSLADRFSRNLVQNKMTPLEGLNDFFADRESLVKFDPLVIKALIKGFLRS